MYWIGSRLLLLLYFCFRVDGDGFCVVGGYVYSVCLGIFFVGLWL